MVQALTGRTAMLPTPGRQRRGVLGPVVGLVALGICGLIVLGIVSNSVGVGGIVVGAICALLPVGPVVAVFLWIDRWEPEPPSLLLFAFLWGACFSALTALLINSGAALVLETVLGNGSGDIYGAVAVAPIVEEAVKGVFLVGLLMFRPREFDGIVDGIVYAGLVAAGFAFTENILYFGRAFAEAGMGEESLSVLSVLFVRGVLSPFAHPLFTAMTGIAAGIAATNRSVGLRIVVIGAGYIVAVALHALWNSSATFLQDGFFWVYLFIMVPVFAAMVIVVIWQRRREQQTVAAQLPGFAQAGWIAPSEIQLLSSMAGRRGWQAAVRRRSGKKVSKAVSEYQAAVTELAFLRSKMARGAVGASGALWHDEAVAALRRARLKAVGHPEALTVALRHHGPANNPGWQPPPPGPPPRAPGPLPPQYPGWQPPPLPPNQPPQSWPYQQR
ncbi:PrsW family intramembrane metalloprotease [Pseudonocardia sp. TRM90224]|uniref:PrsW family intramembrane metalloprotease n=1 Tax=Pseudonocardia sp. TRM90224 TaxID=2812678 RepID=UPI001E47DA8C|nr:PrsW family intramembrane metalloprotease [Pseudonocardia sp. TRM90224]